MATAKTYPGWFRVSAAARYATTTEEMVYRWLGEEGLRHSRVGRTIFIRREWLDDFLGAHEVAQEESIVQLLVDEATNARA